MRGLCGKSLVLALGLAVSLTAVSLTAQTATLLKTDTVTKGNWAGVYGSDGYWIAQSKVSLPGYASGTTVASASNFVWAASTSDPRALTTSTTVTTAAAVARIAACWTSNGSFAFSIPITDGAVHQVAIYLLDWDGFGGGRQESVTVAATATKAVLNTQLVTSFGSGVWLVYAVSGAVTITVTNTNPFF